MDMDRYKKHQLLLKRVLTALQNEYPDGRFFERHVGLFYTIKKKPVKINKKGMSDIWAMISGSHIEIEIKSGNARQTKDQKKWQKITEETGGLYLLIKEDFDIKKIKKTITQHLQKKT